MSKTLALAAAAALVLTGLAPATQGTGRRAALRLEVLAHRNPAGGYSADVFGHRGYAYLSSWHGASCPALGVRVYDVRAPRHPTRVATFADGRSQPQVKGTWTEKTIVQHVSTARFSGDLAVTSFQSCRPGSFQGFGLYDVTHPTRPRELALVHTTPRGSHEIWLQPKGRHAYVYTAIPRSELISSPDFSPSTGSARTPGEPDFRIYDVTDPTRPVKVGEWGAWRALGINASGRVNLVHSVITNSAATRAFLSYWNLGTIILDIRNPSKPRFLGRTPPEHEQTDAHSAWLGRHGTVLVETHELPDGHPSFYDISNVRRPRWLSNLVLPHAPPSPALGFMTGVHDPKVLGSRAYFSWYARGVVIASIANPRRPRILARFVPPPSRDQERALCIRPACSLVWGVYATRNEVLASDMVGGLWVLRLR